MTTQRGKGMNWGQAWLLIGIVLLAFGLWFAFVRDNGAPVQPVDAVPVPPAAEAAIIKVKDRLG